MTCKDCVYYSQYALGYCHFKGEVVHPNTKICKKPVKEIKD